MTALAQEKDALTDREKDMLSYILARFDDDYEEDCDYCEGCEAITYEPDTGYWGCPADGNPYNSNCIRCDKIINWNELKDKAEDFIRNIRDLW